VFHRQYVVAHFKRDKSVRVPKIIWLRQSKATAQRGCEMSPAWWQKSSAHLDLHLN
jgi:hypothetical protein